MYPQFDVFLKKELMLNVVMRYINACAHSQNFSNPFLNNTKFVMDKKTVGIPKKEIMEMYQVSLQCLQQIFVQLIMFVMYILCIILAEVIR